MGVRSVFIKNLKYYRKQAGFTQERLAETIGMSTAYIGDMEARERFPSAETIDKIARALNVRPSQLFDEHGSPENIKDSFRSSYGKSLQEELCNRVTEAIGLVIGKL